MVNKIKTTNISKQKVKMWYSSNYLTATKKVREKIEIIRIKKGKNKANWRENWKDKKMNIEMQYTKTII